MAQSPEKALQSVFGAMAPSMGAPAKQLSAAFWELDGLIEQGYQSAGAPYGDSMEGCDRWIKERGEALQAECQALEAQKIQEEKDFDDICRWAIEGPIPALKPKSKRKPTRKRQDTPSRSF